MSGNFLKLWGRNFFNKLNGKIGENFEVHFDSKNTLITLNFLLIRDLKQVEVFNTPISGTRILTTLDKAKTLQFNSKLVEKFLLKLKCADLGYWSN